MSEKNEVSTTAGQQLDVLQVEDVAGGHSCVSSVSVGTNGISFQGPVSELGQNVISAYEGVIESTSYAIERIANALRQ